MKYSFDPGKQIKKYEMGWSISFNAGGEKFMQDFGGEA
jgi:hypothetical protein